MQIIETSWRSLVQHTTDPSSETCLLQSSLTGPVPLAVGAARALARHQSSFFNFGPTDTDIAGTGNQHGQDRKKTDDKARPGWFRLPCQCHAQWIIPGRSGSRRSGWYTRRRVKSECRSPGPKSKSGQPLSLVSRQTAY